MAEDCHRHPDVVVLGDAAVDWVAPVDELPRRDDIVVAHSCQRFPGGSAANVAVGLARLGHRVSFIGKLGDDENGQLLLAAFEEEGVDTQGVIVRPDCTTSSCFIAVDGTGDRMIVALPRNSFIEHPNELDLEKLEQAQAVYIGPAYSDVAQVAARVARRGGGTVFYAPGGFAAEEG